MVGLSRHAKSASVLLLGHSDDGREVVLREAYSRLCLGKRLLHVNMTCLDALAAPAHGEFADAVVPHAGDVSNVMSQAGLGRRLMGTLAGFPLGCLIRRAAWPYFILLQLAPPMHVSRSCTLYLLEGSTVPYIGAVLP